MKEIFLIISLVFFFLAIIFLLIYLVSEAKGEAAFVGIIGFIPIAFGTSKKAIIAAIVTLFIFFLFFLILWFLFKFL
jgi:uncharacterized membrane protein